MDCSLPGSSFHEILQARILEWVAISFSSIHTHTHTHTHIYIVFPIDSVGKESACNAGDTENMGSIPGSGRPLEKEMATPFSILAWEIPWTK